MRFSSTLILVSLVGGLSVATAADPPLPGGVVLEAEPVDPRATKIVLIAGSSTYKPGEHEYLAGCAVLADLLKQTGGIAPVIALDWPKNPSTFAGARCVVFLFDGAEKHQAIKDDRLARLLKFAESGVGFVPLHQTVDVPVDFGERFRTVWGAAWEKGHSQRAHWIANFDKFPQHEIFRGVKPFAIDDGWLTKLRFAANQKGLTPLLKTSDPKSTAKLPEESTTVSWAFERPGGGRTFGFTGGHLHSSMLQEGYRRFLVNGILWSAGIEVPTTGAPVELDEKGCNKYLNPKPDSKK